MIKKIFSPKPPEKWWESKTAVVGGHFSENYAFMEGYYKASHILNSSALKEETKMSDLTFLFYPICYNYRHYVELSLKHLVEQLEKYYSILKELDSTYGKLEESVVPKLVGTHELDNLLRWYIERLKLVIEDPKINAEILKTIRQLIKYDHDGQNFRYPDRTSGDQGLPRQLWVDLEELCRHMKDVHDYLFGMGIWLDEEIQQAGECLFEYQREFGNISY
jgi:hypothetical protein